MTSDIQSLIEEYGLDRCNRCGRCLGVCKLYHRERNEFYSPRGFIQLLLQGYNLTIGQKVLIRRYCANCSLCSEICQNDVKIAELLHTL